VIIGGVAAVLQGSAQFTQDLDICYNRTQENFQKIIQALTPLHPKLRNAPEDLPFIFDERSLKNGLNFTFKTDLGDLDLLGEVGGIGFYPKVFSQSTEKEVFGLKCRVLNLDALILSKKFAGRKKDEPVIYELEAIKELQEREKQKGNQ
jgi:hypothetical protein